MESSTQHLARMASQIATFFTAQSQDDPGEVAKSVASHLKLFWAPSMRVQLIEAFDAGTLVGLDPAVAAALRVHRHLLLAKADRVAVPNDETFPEGGGDAG